MTSSFCFPPSAFRPVVEAADAHLSPSGRMLLVDEADRAIASLHANTSSAHVGVPRRLFSLGDIAQAPLMMPDGDILVGEQRTKPTPRIEVTTAWSAKMR